MFPQIIPFKSTPKQCILTSLNFSNYICSLSSSFLIHFSGTEKTKQLLCEPALHDIYIARCELRFRKSLADLTNILSNGDGDGGTDEGAIGGEVGHLNVESCQCSQLTSVVVKAKTVRTSFGK